MSHGRAVGGKKQVRLATGKITGILFNFAERKEGGKNFDKIESNCTNQTRESGNIRL